MNEAELKGFVMNRNQKIILWIGTLAICAMAVFPPWNVVGGSRFDFWGYRSLFWYDRNLDGRVAVDRLGLQILFVAILTFTGVMTTGTQRNRE